MLAKHGTADLAEFRARLAELRQTLRPPSQPGAFIAYTDGACLGNPDGPGGWAAVLAQIEDDPDHTWELWGHLSSTSNNRAEALGVLAAMLWAPASSALVIRSDSELTVRILSGIYKAKANMDVWAEIRAAEQHLRITVEWVPGHAGEPGNEQADKLSVLGAVNGDPERLARQRSARPKVRGSDPLAGLKPQGEWETDFLSSVARQLREGRALSQKQQAIVDRIRARTRT